MTQLEKDTFYMEFAKHSASKSKDPRTKVGSCLVNDKRLLSIGYNGAPRGFPDEIIPRDSDSDILSENKNVSIVSHKKDLNPGAGCGEKGFILLQPSCPSSAAPSQFQHNCPGDKNQCSLNWNFLTTFTGFLNGKARGLNIRWSEK